MTDTELREIIYDWIDLVLNTNYSLSIPIIFGEQNAPRPDSDYIVIHKPIPMNKQGHGDRSYSDDSGITTIRNNYESTISIECVGKETYYLRLLLESTDTQEVKEFWQTRNVSYLRNAGILSIPNMTENQWELRTTVDIFMLVLSSIEEDTSYINDIDYTNNILS